MKINDLNYLDNIDQSDNIEGGLAIATSFPVTAVASGPNFTSTGTAAATQTTTTLTVLPVGGGFIGIPSNTSSSAAASGSSSS